MADDHAVEVGWERDREREGGRGVGGTKWLKRKLSSKGLW